jgi:putative transposase
VIRSLLYLLLRRVLGLVGPNDRMAAQAELEIAVLRYQVTILRRQVKRPVYRTSDRAFLAAARGVGGVPGWPETLLRWHRQLVRRKWTRPPALRDALAFIPRSGS